MALANITLTNTFDEWRTRTNQLIVQGDQIIISANAAYNQANAANSLANSVAFAANAYATSVGTASNNYAVTVGTAANNRANTVGAGSNAYAITVGTAGNAYALSIATTIGTAGNNYSITIGTASNNYAIAVGTAANSRTTAVGAADNAYALSIATTIGTAGNSYATNATNMSTGTLPVARLSGSYTSVTGVGTLTAGVWNATTIAVAYGGTGATDAANARTNLGAAPLVSPALSGTPTAPTAASYATGTQIATVQQVYDTVTREANQWYNVSSFTPSLADSGKAILNGQAMTFNVPTDASVAFPVGTRMDIIQWAAGQVTFSPAVGVNLFSAGGKRTTRIIYSGATLLKTNSNEWALIGDLI